MDNASPFEQLGPDVQNVYATGPCLKVGMEIMYLYFMRRGRTGCRNLGLRVKGAESLREAEEETVESEIHEMVGSGQNVWFKKVFILPPLKVI